MPHPLERGIRRRAIGQPQSENPTQLQSIWQGARTALDTLREHFVEDSALVAFINRKQGQASLTLEEYEQQISQELLGEVLQGATENRTLKDLKILVNGLRVVSGSRRVRKALGKIPLVAAQTAGVGALDMAYHIDTAMGRLTGHAQTSNLLGLHTYLEASRLTSHHE